MVIIQSKNWEVGAEWFTDGYRARQKEMYDFLYASASAGVMTAGNATSRDANFNARAIASELQRWACTADSVLSAVTDVRCNPRLLGLKLNL